MAARDERRAPPESPELAAVVAAGCRNPLSFTPNRVTADAPLVPNQPVSLDLFALPSADLMVGDVTARVAYASLVVYDDRDGDGTLHLARPRRLPPAARTWAHPIRIRRPRRASSTARASSR